MKNSKLMIVILLYSVILIMVGSSIAKDKEKIPIMEELAMKQMIPGLINKFDGGGSDSGGRVLNRDAVKTVVEKGDLAIHSLMRGLENQNYAIRWGSIEALAQMDIKAQPVVLKIAKLANDKEWQVRRAALEAIEEFKIWNSGTIRALGILALDTEEPRPARYLSNPPGIQNAVMLSETYYSKDNSSLAITILGNIGQQALPTLKGLKERLKGDRFRLVQEMIDKINSQK